MSAFMFSASDKLIKSSTVEELEGMLARMKPIVDNFDWSTYQQTHFKSDQAAGYAASIKRIEYELRARKDGFPDDEIPSVLVPGYNPGKSK